ncbi:hypothetical protein CBS101457_005068 [Exobasidium rhododendri]|nr:hypothetical protein CBS101457_005068 [Exobasidium rhododendri]
MAVDQSGIVLVTGANGFIGSHVVQQLLERGVKVRAIVRSETSAESLRRAFPRAQISYGFVPDITAPHAYDDVVKGVSGIVHVAAPLLAKFKGDNVEDFIKPSVNSIESILESASKEQSVRKVVFTSSVVAQCSLPNNGAVITSDSWNPITYEQTATTKDLFEAYSGSKTLAERRAWAYVKEKKPHFQFAVINPSFVLGPVILDHQKINEGTNAYIWAFATAKQQPDSIARPWTDVRDVARAHVEALYTSDSTGKRFTLCGSMLQPGDIARVARQNVPELNSSEETQDKPTSADRYVTEDAESILGISWIPAETSIIDTLKQGVALAT